MVNLTLYVEGGGDTREQKARLRRGLSSFLERANLQGRMPRIVASGGRDVAYDKVSKGTYQWGHGCGATSGCGRTGESRFKLAPSSRA